MLWTWLDLANLPLKFGQNKISNSWDIPDIDKCHQDKCCLNNVTVTLGISSRCSQEPSFKKYGYGYVTCKKVVYSCPLSTEPTHTNGFDASKNSVKKPTEIEVVGLGSDNFQRGNVGGDNLLSGLKVKGTDLDWAGRMNERATSVAIHTPNVALLVIELIRIFIQ